MSVLDDFLKNIPTEQHALIRSLDAVISKAAPPLEASLKWGILTYHGEKNVCSLISLKNHVHLQVWHGTKPKDPSGLLEGTGKGMRHFTIASAADIDTKGIADLVKQAAQLGGA